MRPASTFAVPLLVLLGTAGGTLRPLFGGIVATSPNVLILSEPPASLEVHVLEDNQRVMVFEERTRTLLQRLAVDIARAGTYEAIEPMAPGYVAAGTTVSSFYVHADPVGRVPNEEAIRYRGWISFASPILGLMVQATTLADSDRRLGLPEVDYPQRANPPQGVLERHDFLTLSEDRKTVRFVLAAGLRSDDFRLVIRYRADNGGSAGEDPSSDDSAGGGDGDGGTGDGGGDFELGEDELGAGATAPEPSSAGLLALGAFGLGWARRKITRSRNDQKL